MSSAYSNGEFCAGYQAGLSSYGYLRTAQQGHNGKASYRAVFVPLEASPHTLAALQHAHN